VRTKVKFKDVRTSDATITLYEDSPTTTEFLGNNCILLTYFSGDVSSKVNEHFNRSLARGRRDAENSLEGEQQTVDHSRHAMIAAARRIKSLAPSVEFTQHTGDVF